MTRVFGKDKLEELAVRSCKSILLSSAFAVLFAGSALPSETLVIGWDMLMPPQSSIEDPFAKLSRDQLDGLRQILRFDMSKDTGSPSIAPEAKRSWRSAAHIVSL